MVRKVGFGDGEDNPDTGPVRRGEPPKKADDQPVKDAGTVVPDPEPEAPAEATAAEEHLDVKPPEAPVPVAGTPRWGAILVLLAVLTVWLSMSGLVVAGIVRRSSDGVPFAHLFWVVLAFYGVAVLLRKLQHLYRGGSWLQTPADAARKAAGKGG